MRSNVYNGQYLRFSSEALFRRQSMDSNDYRINKKLPIEGPLQPAAAACSAVRSVATATCDGHLGGLWRLGRSGIPSLHSTVTVSRVERTTKMIDI